VVGNVGQVTNSGTKFSRSGAVKVLLTCSLVLVGAAIPHL